MEQLFSIIRSVLNRWKLWTILPLIAMTTVTLLTSSQKKTFISEATLNINFQSSKGLSLTDDVLQQYEINQYFENLIQLTRSRKNIELVRLTILKDFYLEKHKFIKFEPADSTLKDSSIAMPIIARLIREKKLLNTINETQSAINLLLKKNNLSHEHINGSLGMARVGKSNYISLVYETDAPTKAAYINTLIIETMEHLYKSISKHRSEFDKDMFEKLVAQSKGVLDKKIKKLEKYKIQKNVINLSEHTKAIVNQVVNMEIQLSHLKEIRASKQRAVERIKKDYAGDMPLPVDLKSNQKIVDLKRQLSQASSDLVINRFKKNQSDVDLEAKETKIKGLKDAISREITNLVTETPYDPRQTKQEMVYRLIGYQLDVEMAKEAIPVVRNEITRILSYAKQFAPLESTIGSMEDEIYVAQQGYLILLNKLNLAKTVAKGKGEGEIHIVDIPSIPLKPKPGKRALIIVISGIVVFLLIVVSVVLIEVLDASISTVDRFEKVSSFKVIAAIPDLNSEAIKKGVVKLKTADQILYQQIKAIRKEILSLPKEKSITLWVCGHRMEGKQWLSVKLIEALHKINKKVLLIHGDPLDGPLPDVPLPVLGNHPLQILNCDKSGILKLTDIGVSPLEMMDETNWQKTFDELQQTYDFIFIIAPPLEQTSDWKEWALFAKSVTYMFRANQTFKSNDKRSMDMIQDQGLEVVGSILNKIDIEKMENYIGNIPKRRSRIRQIIKHLIERDFGGLKGSLTLKRTGA